jgi:ribonuclease-3
MPVDFGQFEKIGNLHFKNKKLLQQAFTHRSYINEHKRLKLDHNERLEFLGDAVLELITTEYLYEKYPKETEGDLTAYRSALVNANTLSDISRKLGMEKYLLLSKGESKDTGRARQYILANTFEALIGALFLDQGYEAAKRFIAHNLFPLTEQIVEEKLWLDAKSHFQEKAQEKMGVTPTYKTMQESGPDHDKHFTVAVFLGERKIAEGTGRSKQEAEQSAARNALSETGWMSVA